MANRERHQRREAKAKRRRKRLQKGGALRRATRRAVQAREGQDRFWNELMKPIIAQSKPRQKRLDQASKNRRVAREKGWLA